MKVKKGYAISLWMFLLLSVGVPSGSTTAESRQSQLDNALAQAIAKYDTPAAVAALNAGANPNHRYYLWALSDPRRKVYEKLLLQDKTQYACAPLTHLFTPRSAPNGDGLPFPPGERLVLLKALLEHGANVNPKRSAGDTPLFMAALYGYSDSVRLLIAYGAEVNVQNDTFGITPLMWCVLRDKPDLVQLLLDHHADIHHKDKMGNTALTWALAYKYMQCAEVLKRAGAKE